MNRTAIIIIVAVVALSLSFTLYIKITTDNRIESLEKVIEKNRPDVRFSTPTAEERVKEVEEMLGRIKEEQKLEYQRHQDYADYRRELDNLREKMKMQGMMDPPPWKDPMSP